MKIAIEIGDRGGERRASGNLSSAYKALDDYRKDIEYNEKDMKIAITISDRAAEGRTYGSLGNAYNSLSVWSSSGQVILPSSILIFINDVNYSAYFACRQLTNLMLFSNPL